MTQIKIAAELLRQAKAEDAALMVKIRRVLEEWQKRWKPVAVPYRPTRLDADTQEIISELDRRGIRIPGVATGPQVPPSDDNSLIPNYIIDGAMSPDGIRLAIVFEQATQTAGLLLHDVLERLRGSCIVKEGSVEEAAHALNKDVHRVLTGLAQEGRLFKSMGCWHYRE